MAGKDLDLDGLLKIFHLLGERRLRDKALLSSRGKAVFISYGHKVLEML